MYKWTVEYISENTERWENERKEREMERKETIQEWDKKNRLEKIRTLKEKWRNKPTNTEQKKKGKTDTWSIWREKEQPEGKEKMMKENAQKIQKERDRDTEQQKVYPIFLKMKKPKLKVKTNEEKTQKTEKPSSPIPSPGATQVLKIPVIQMTALKKLRVL